jgi:hypothetical protein
MQNIIQLVAMGLLDNTQIANLLAFIWSLVESGADGKKKIAELDAQVARVVAENRRPKPEEWAGWGLRSEAAYERIQAAPTK